MLTFIGAIIEMVKPGSIIGGFIIAISMAMQIITIVEIVHYYYLLFIWIAGLIVGVTYVLGGLAFEQDKLEYFTISGISLGAIGAIAIYFAVFQSDTMYYNYLTPTFTDPSRLWWMVGWIFGSIVLSVVAAFLMCIAPLFIAAGAGKQLKGVKPGAILGGILISGSLALQIITVIHFAKYYPLLVFWFIGLIGAISLAIGAKAKWGYNSTEAFVTAGVFIGILLVLVIWWTVSPQMKVNIGAKIAEKDLGNIVPTVLSFVSGVIAFFGVLFCAASEKKRAY